MRSFTLPAVLAAAALAVGCAGAGYSGTVYASSGDYEPDLVTVGPGVSVIADYNEPIFYSDNLYWRFYNGGWYRSPYYDRGWAYYSSPPVAVSRIRSPNMYRHYRPQGYVVRRDRGSVYRSTPVRRDRGDYRRGGGIRDHRRY